MPFGIGHELVIQISRSALWSFFADISLQDEHNIPAMGPVIVAATHHNMILDPAILSVTIPGQLRFHYWGKDSMFSHPLAKRFLENCGVVPVDRKNKNNAQLYAATYEVLRLGESVAVFPEGTSHTLPHMGVLKDGTSFAALEYAKQVEDDPRPNPDGSLPRKPTVLPVGIVYSEKSKYRSVVIVKYGKPISVDPYLATYRKDPKKAAKQLTADLANALMSLTINAPDWESRDAAEMARRLLLPGDNKSMRDYIPVTQSLITAFAELAKTDSEVAVLQQSLRAYKLELDALALKDSHIAKYDEKDITAIATTVELLRHTLASLLDLPLILPGVVGHLPLYIAGHFAGKFEIYEEVRAQDKIMLGILLLPIVYISAFIWAWLTLFGGTWFGFLEALATLGIFAWYHTVMIDERYEDFKDLMGRWRLFDAFVLGRGMWRRKQRILHLKVLRDTNIENVRKMVKRYRNKNKAVHAVSLAIHTRAKQLADLPKLRGKTKSIARQYAWSSSLDD